MFAGQTSGDSALGAALQVAEKLLVCNYTCDLGMFCLN